MNSLENIIGNLWCLATHVTTVELVVTSIHQDTKSGRGLQALFNTLIQYTKVRFASFLSGGFTTMTVINPPERKLSKRTSVQCFAHSTLCFH